MKQTNLVEELVTKQAKLNLEARIQAWEGLTISLEECKLYTKNALIQLN
jgi:hypothetical protein